MPSLISVVTSARWIDLSEKHKGLREYLESSIKTACVDNKPDGVIMVKGAFGIGKTNTLHYLFHYGWCKINVPVLFVSLEKLYPHLEKYAHSLPDKKIGNVALGAFLDQKVTSALKSLAEGVPNEDSKLFFLDWENTDLSTFCKNFCKLKLSKYESNGFVEEEYAQLTAELIETVIAEKNRPLLLIDEFETKFTKLKSLIEASNGGELRELFDDVVEKRVSFNLIIGNGPASGYELKNANSNHGSDDAESSRLIPKQVPFPYPETTKEFLQTDNRGLLNFAWWASRCRARHFLRIKESVGSLDNLLSKRSYAEFLNDFSFFNDPIESSNEGSSPITYVRTEYLTDFPERLKDLFLPRLISEIQPIPISFDDYRDSILKAKKYLFCGNGTINVSEKIMIALSEDINESILRNHKENGNYQELDYDKTLRKYFDFFLKSIADENGEIVFGMTDDTDAQRSFSDLFLLPLIHLTYDFIAQYEEESLPANKQALEFLLDTLTDVKNKVTKNELKSFLPKTYRLFKRNDDLEGNGYIQLSLGAIRETFEQPIGEPKLNYKNYNLSDQLDKIEINATIPIIKHSDSHVEILFIPDLPEHLLKPYIANLREYILKDLHIKIHNDGFLAVGIIYISDSILIEDFEKSVLFLSDNSGNSCPAHLVGKFNFFKISSIGLNFPGLTSDFLDSVIKIGLIGFHNGDLNHLIDNENKEIEIKNLINKIKQPDWTERKEIRRTIEHFEKLVLSNDKSEIKSITTHVQRIYDEKLSELISDRANFDRSLRKYSLDDSLYATLAASIFTKRIIFLFLIDNKEIPDKFFELLKNVDDLKLLPSGSDKVKRVQCDVFKRFIQTNGLLIKKHFETFSTEDTIVKDVIKLTNIVLQSPLPANTDVYLDYLNYDDEHFIRSYFKKLGDYLSLSFSESIYNRELAVNINLVDAKDQLLSKIHFYKVKINEIRVDIDSYTEKIREILKMKEAPYEYKDELGIFNTKILAVIEQILNKNYSISVLIVMSDIIKYFDSIIEDAILLKDQLSELVKKFEDMHTVISPLQANVNDTYDNDFISNILTNVHGIKKQNGDHYWSHIILQTVRAIPLYQKIFDKSEYLPTKSKTINVDELKKFIEELDKKFVDKKAEIDLLKADLDGYVSEIQQLIDVENELKELLIVGE